MQFYYFEILTLVHCVCVWPSCPRFTVYIRKVKSRPCHIKSKGPILCVTSSKNLLVLSKLWILGADWSMHWSRDMFLIKLRLYEQSIMVSCKSGNSDLLNFFKPIFHSIQFRPIKNSRPFEIDWNRCRRSKFSAFQLIVALCWYGLVPEYV